MLHFKTSVTSFILFQVIVPVPHVAKTASSAAAAAMGKDVEAAVTGLVHMFSVSHCFHLTYRDLIAELNNLFIN